MNGSPRYSPPYDSPLEDEFARNVDKYVGDSVQLETQVPVRTLCGLFFIDFVARKGDLSVAFECDGEAFHDYSRDAWRDSLILGDGAVDVIYRFRGTDLFRRMEDCLYVVSQYNPSLFGQRGSTNLKTLSSPEVRDAFFDAATGRMTVQYAPAEGGRQPRGVAIERRYRVTWAGERVWWQDYYDFAAARGGGDLDAVRTAYQQQRLAP